VKPRHEHWIATKQILRYLRGMINYGLRCMVLLIQIGHGVQMTERVLLVYVLLGSTMISWASRKQKFVALITT
jgi:hypothetical protein